MGNNDIISFYKEEVNKNQINYITFRKINKEAKRLFGIDNSKNYDSLIVSSLICKEQFNLNSYRNKNGEYLKISVIAIEQSIEFLTSGLKGTIGLDDKQIFKRLAFDAAHIYENIFEGLNLTPNNKNRFYLVSYSRNYGLLENLMSLKFALKSNAENNHPNSLCINQRILLLITELRKLIELFFNKCLNNWKHPNEFISSNGKAYYELKKLFSKSVSDHIVIYKDGNNNKFDILIKFYEILGNIIHRSWSPPIFIPLFILEYLLDNYFNIEFKNQYRFSGNVVLNENIKIDEEKLKEFLKQKIPDYL